MPATFKALRRRLNELPRTVAASVAGRAAPALTDMTRGAFDAGRDVYGQARPKSETTGEALTLKRSGAAERTLKFAAVGTIVRCVLGVPYLKYLIGKYRVLPNGPIPQAWRGRLGEIVRETKAPP
jgi:hypothetical protein